MDGANKRAKQIADMGTDEEFAYLLGRFAGDGWFQKRGIAIGTKHESEAEFIAELMRRIFSKEPKAKFRKYSDGHELYQVSMYSVETEKHFREILGNIEKEKSKNFRIPESIITNDVLRRRFIQGIFDAEGSFRIWRGKPRVQMDIYNRTAAEAIQDSIRNDGIKSSLSICSDGACRIETTGEKNVELFRALYHYPARESPGCKPCPFDIGILKGDARVVGKPLNGPPGKYGRKAET